MAEQVIMWRGADGKIYDNEEEADISLEKDALHSVVVDSCTLDHDDAWEVVNWLQRSTAAAGTWSEFIQVFGINVRQ